MTCDCFGVGFFWFIIGYLVASDIVKSKFSKTKTSKPVEKHSKFSDWVWNIILVIIIIGIIFFIIKFIVSLF